jgi:hypothetical protein
LVRQDLYWVAASSTTRGSPSTRASPPSRADSTSLATIYTTARSGLGQTADLLIDLGNLYTKCGKQDVRFLTVPCTKIIIDEDERITLYPRQQSQPSTPTSASSSTAHMTSPGTVTGDVTCAGMGSTAHSPAATTHATRKAQRI